MNMSVLDDLQKWYTSNCDGEWQEEYGVEIGTLDNPGWSVTIDLEDTNLEGKDFQRFENRPLIALNLGVKNRRIG